MPSSTTSEKAYRDTRPWRDCTPRQQSGCHAEVLAEVGSHRFASDIKRFPNAAFFKIADGHGGHTQVLALFDRSDGPGHRGTDAATSTIDHIAFEVSLPDFEAERTRLEALGLQVETAEHAWVHWRSLYVTDPEGNQVELVCYDARV